MEYIKRKYEQQESDNWRNEWDKWRQKDQGLTDGANVRNHQVVEAVTDHFDGPSGTGKSTIAHVALGSID